MSTLTKESVEMKEVKQMKRIASLDFQRGLAIFMMVILHEIQHMYDISWATNIDQLLQKSPLIIASVFLIAFLSGWAGYFLLISAIVNVLAMTKKAAKGYDPNKILAKQILTGVGLLIVGAITEGLLYYGYIGTSIRSKGTTPWAIHTVQDFWLRFGRAFFTMETLQAIGWCMIINGIIHYFLIKNKGYLKIKRNVLIYAGLAFAILALSYPLWRLIDPLYPKWPDEVTARSYHNFKTYIFVVLAGDLEPLFPFLSVSFIGSIIGILLAKPKPSKKLPQYLGIASFGFAILGGILLVIGEITKDPLVRFDFTWNRPNLSYFMFLLFAWIGVVALLLNYVEFKGNPEKFANRKFVRTMRLWGTVALTVFSLQIFSLLPRWLFSFLVDDDLVRDKLPYEKAGYALLVALFVTYCYHLLIVTWSKKNFKYSFEWFIIRLASLGTKEVSNRLDVDTIMNKTYWISFKEPIVIDEKEKIEVVPKINSEE
ncbi:MAG: heparan-alpha-glucosaminide N-acetyltransferase domain-containing protein [Candidatus Heimdallarchaeaceae archaeon]